MSLEFSNSILQMIHQIEYWSNSGLIDYECYNSLLAIKNSLYKIYYTNVPTYNFYTPYNTSFIVDSFRNEPESRKRRRPSSRIDVYETDLEFIKYEPPSIYDTEPELIDPKDLLDIDVTKIKEKYIYIHERFNINRHKVISEPPSKFNNSSYTMNGLKLYFIDTKSGIKPYKFYNYYVGQNGFLYQFNTELKCIIPVVYNNLFHKWK